MVDSSPSQREDPGRRWGRKSGEGAEWSGPSESECQVLRGRHAIIDIAHGATAAQVLRLITATCVCGHTRTQPHAYTATCVCGCVCVCARVPMLVCACVRASACSVCPCCSPDSLGVGYGGVLPVLFYYFFCGA